MKIAFVVQRYGLEVNGGAELHCRWIAEHMSMYHNIEIITTCAKDYITWKNEYMPGKDNINGIVVWRFPVDSIRNKSKFDKFSEKIFENNHDIDDEIKWMTMQGPYSEKLFDFINDSKDDYDFFIFFTYLYCTTFFGLPLVKNKAILVPTAHDEPPIYLHIFDSIFKDPKVIIYNTEEEKKFVNIRFNNGDVPSEIIGVGINVPKKIDKKDFKQKYNLDDFIIYVGRVDESKGCKELFEYFLRYKIETQSDIKLVLLGKLIMDIPKHDDIISLGFVSEQDKFNGIKAAELLIVPSKYESLSMVLMESWLCDNTVLVNGNCNVLRIHCINSNGGLYYTNYDEFGECLNVLLNDQIIRYKMGQNGRKYVVDNYDWNIIENKYIRLFKMIENDKNVDKWKQK